MGATGAAGAGVVAKRRQRGKHRRRRERRRMTGMLLHIDGSKHRWLGRTVARSGRDPGRCHSEIYYAQLVEEESTRTVMAGLREVIARKGLFCALYSDRGSHFSTTPKAGEKVDGPSHASGPGDEGVGSPNDCGLFSASAGPLGAQLWDLAGAAAARVEAGGIGTLESPIGSYGNATSSSSTRSSQSRRNRRGRRSARPGGRTRSISACSMNGWWRKTTQSRSARRSGRLARRRLRTAWLDARW